MATDKRYSLWAVPDEDSREYSRLTQLIKEYSERYDDAPRFQPHVTVLGRIHADGEAARQRAEDLATDHDPVDITLRRPHCSTTYFQCVYLLAEPSAEILDLHLDASDAYGKEFGMYVPHLSLVYSEMPVGQRRQLVDEFDTSMLPLTFTAETLRLMATGDVVEDWEVVADYDLR